MSRTPPRIESTLARAETLHLLGERYASKNDHVAADSRFRDALAVRRELNAPALDIAATLDSFGRMLSLTGEYDRRPAAHGGIS